MPERDFDVLYQETPIHVRGNANLPGRFVYHINTLEFIMKDLDKNRELLERAYPGYGTDWTWRDFGLTDEDHNPLRDYTNTYLQLSRSEAMKGSEQVVRGFQSNLHGDVEGVGVEPNLNPSATKNGTTVQVYTTASQDAKRTKRRLGLGR